MLDYRNARIRLEINNAWKYLLMQSMVYFEDDPCKGFPIAMVKVWSDAFLGKDTGYTLENQHALYITSRNMPRRETTDCPDVQYLN